VRWIVHGVLFVAQAVSLGCYALLYRQVLAALGARVRFRLAADVTLASFFVSHLTPFGSATGTVVNVSTLEAEGVDAPTPGSPGGLGAGRRAWRGTSGLASIRTRWPRPLAGSPHWPGPR
jgi:hypothetical protein